MSYGGFAEFYDLLTSNVNYAGYAGRIRGILKGCGTESPRIVELACGTLSLGLELKKAGFDVIGTDISDEMLKRAAQKSADRGFCVPVFKCDMTDFTLPFKGGAFVCSLDGFNHLDGMGSVAATFRAVRKNIIRGGLLIFDMNTPYKHKNVLGDNSFIIELPGVYCGWQNEFRDDDCSVKITLDIFSESGGVIRHVKESFREYAYPQKDVERSLKASGFEVLDAYDGLKNIRPGPRTERILYVARSI